MASSKDMMCFKRKPVPSEKYSVELEGYINRQLSIHHGDVLTTKITLYREIHKGQRRWLFDISSMAARLDFADRGQVELLREDIKAFYVHLTEHVETEEKFIHPVLNERVPSSTRAIEVEHKVFHKDLEELLAGLEAITRMDSEHETIHTIGYEIYLAWNRFISAYLRHIDVEEEHLQQVLLNVCRADELMDIFRSIMTSMTNPSMMVNLRLIALGVSDDELTVLMRSARPMMPPEAFEGVLGYVGTLLEPQRWSRISASIRQ